jgi:hypothetical protein
MPDLKTELSDGTVEKIRRGLRGATIRADEENRRIKFVCSTEDVARDGHMIRADGWKLENFNANAVFLWCHKTDEPPIGKFTNIGVEEFDGKPALVGEVEFADAATYPFADTVFRLYQGGFLNAVSVQWEPLAWEPLEDSEGRQTGLVFTESELLETSAVPVPADPKALVVATQRGVVTPEEVDRLAERLAGDSIVDLESEVREMNTQQEPTAEVEEQETPEIEAREVEAPEAEDTERGVVLEALEDASEAVDEGDPEQIADAFGTLKAAIDSLTEAVSTVSDMVNPYDDENEMPEDEEVEAEDAPEEDPAEMDDETERAGKKVSADRAGRILEARAAAEKIVDILAGVLGEDESRSIDPEDDGEPVAEAAVERSADQADDYAAEVLGDLLDLGRVLKK